MPPLHQRSRWSPNHSCVYLSSNEYWQRLCSGDWENRTLQNSHHFYKWYSELTALRRQQIEGEYGEYLAALSQRLQAAEGVTARVDRSIDALSSLQSNCTAVCSKVCLLDPRRRGPWMSSNGTDSTPATRSSKHGGLSSIVSLPLPLNPSLQLIQAQFWQLITHAWAFSWKCALMQLRNLSSLSCQASRQSTLLPCNPRRL